MKKPWVLSYPFSAQRRLWSDLADAQANLSLRWAHSHFVGFVMSRLILKHKLPLYSHLSLTREWPSIVARGKIIPLKFEQYSGLTNECSWSGGREYSHLSQNVVSVIKFKITSKVYLTANPINRPQIINRLMLEFNWLGEGTRYLSG